MPILILFLTLLFMTNIACADETKVDPAALSVSAQGKIQLAPDTAIVNLAVETAGATFELVSGENQTNIRPFTYHTGSPFNQDVEIACPVQS